MGRAALDTEAVHAEGCSCRGRAALATELGLFQPAVRTATPLGACKALRDTASVSKDVERQRRRNLMNIILPLDNCHGKAAVRTSC